MKYIAYGSNLNLKQMAHRCPTAKVVGTAMLENYRLVFNGVASIINEQGAKTPIGIWEIDKDCERALDRYEGYPYLYRREFVEVEFNGKTMKCLVYIMNKNQPSLPSISYFNAILDGYRDVGLDECYLIQALEDTEKRIRNK